MRFFIVGLLVALGLSGVAGELRAAPVPADQLIIVSRLSGRCVVPEGGATAVGAKLVQRVCTGAAAEQWKLVPVVNGYRIVSQATGFCVAVNGDPKTQNAALVQASCGNVAGETWRVIKNDEWVSLQLRRSGYCMAVAGAARADNTKIIQGKCGTGNEQRWSLSTQPLPASWTAKLTLSTIPVAAANLPDGRVLAWSAYRRFAYAVGTGQTFTTIIDPVSMSATETLVSETGHDMFCPGTALLADGRLLVNGGSSSEKTSIFDPASNTWSAASAMNIPRGYEANTLTSLEEVLTLGGSWNGGLGGKHGEIWTDGVGWRKMPGIPVDPFIAPDPGGIFRADNHIWLAAWRDGWVFQAGPSAAMHWIDTKGFGNVVDAGLRGSDPYAMNGNAILFDVGKLLTIGGAPAYSGSTANATDTAYVIDFSGGPDVPVTLTRQRSMAFPRAMHNSVVLPTGDVVVIGGMNQSVGFSDRGSVLMPEIWSPVTGTFTRLPPMAVPRNYHSMALLLLDGRVMAGGGGLCGLDCTANHPDIEILTPPYLLNPDGTPAPRPELRAAPPSAVLGETISVATSPDAATFALVRMAAATHSVNNDQRRIPLAVSGGSANTGYSLTIPDDPGIVLPGNYMLFALDAAGHPSVARVINLRPSAT
ncbi:MAG: RICIN domain-containing protein [Geminicoccaceae bacterium]